MLGLGVRVRCRVRAMVRAGVRRAKHLRFLPVGLIYANFMLGLGALKHLLFTRVRCPRYLGFLIIYANFMLGLDRELHQQ